MLFLTQAIQGIFHMQEPKLTIFMTKNHKLKSIEKFKLVPFNSHTLEILSHVKL
jgi:hypothetical protein